MPSSDLQEIIDPSHTALIVVDVQNDFCAAAGAFGKVGRHKQGERIIPVVDQVIKATREAGAQVIWLRQTRDPNGHFDSKAKRRSSKKYLDEPRCVRGTFGHAIVEELHPADNEIIIDKPSSSGFYATVLEHVLRSHDIDTLILVGVATEGCVDATARSAAHRGYFVVPIRDAMGSTDPRLHEAAVTIMEQRYDVITADELVQTWASA